MLLLPHHPGFMETSFTASTQITFGGGAKPSNGTQQYNWWVSTGDRFLHYTDKDTGSTKQMGDICRQQSHHHEETSSEIWRRAISIQSWCSHFKGNWAFNTSTPWRKGPHWSSQELSSWPTAEVTTTDNLVIRSTCYASTTYKSQRLSKLEFSSVIATAADSSPADIPTPTGNQPR